MGFDSIFNGDPNAKNVTSSGKASLGVNLSSARLYIKDDAIAGWQLVGPAGDFLVLVEGQDPGSYQG